MIRFDIYITLFSLLVKYVHALALANCGSENKLLHLYGLNMQQLVYDERVKDNTRLIIVNKV